MAENRTILIVEDNLDLSEMLSAYFRELGYLVEAVTTGEEGLERAADVNPDIILLDINLPGIDGYEVCRRIRSSGRKLQMPVIFMTERQKRRDRLTGLELGAVDYVAKPFDIQELGLRVRNTVTRSGMRSPTNPITSLPDESLTRAQLADMLNQPDWGIVLAGIGGLSDFSDTYGFVAADDVARATAVMLRQAADTSGGCEFMGHIAAADFVIITSLFNVNRLAQECLQRLDAAIPYFYPAADWQGLQESPESGRLSAHIAKLTSAEGPATTFEELRLALLNALDDS